VEAGIQAPVKPRVCHKCGTPLEPADRRCWACRAAVPADGWPADPRVGDVVLGRLSITRRVGYGGTGSIYLCEDPGGGSIAVKLLRPEMTRDPDMVRRFRLEAVLTKSLGIPQVVPTYDFGTLPDGTSYLTMEYVQGVSLDDVLAERGTLSLEVALEVTRQVLAALSAAHARGVIHRDLKPGNLILARDPEGRPLVRILDFGFAKVLAEADDGCPTPVARLTRGLSILGTPHYMSPEQCRGARDIDGRTDLYSAGVILYRMIAGVPPFDADSPGEVIQQHLEKVPVAPSARWPDAPPALDRIVLRLLEKDRDRRYPTAAAALADLDAAYPSSSHWDVSRVEGAAVGRSELFRQIRHQFQSTGGAGLKLPWASRIPWWGWAVAAGVAGAAIAVAAWALLRA